MKVPPVELLDAGPVIAQMVVHLETQFSLFCS